MIVYLDSCSAVKLYVKEPETPIVHSLVEAADAVATSRVTYAEVRAALAQARRDRRIESEEDYQRAVQDFRRDWQSYTVLAVSERLVRQAGDLAEKHALRGYDAVQLASALELKRRIPTEVRFSSYDIRLKRAAEAEGLMAV